MRRILWKTLTLGVLLSLLLISTFTIGAADGMIEISVPTASAPGLSNGTHVLAELTRDDGELQAEKPPAASKIASKSNKKTMVPKPIPEPVREFSDLPTPLSSGSDGLNAIIITENPDANPGEAITLTAMVVSTSKGTTHYQWQLNRGDAEWEDIPGVTDHKFVYLASAPEYEQCRFRVKINDDSGHELYVEQRPESIG